VTYCEAVDRARIVAAVVFPLVIGLGAVGAWAFNPDSGAVLHDALLWHVFGGMFEIGTLVLIASVLLFGVLTVCRKLLSIRDPTPRATGRSGRR
jgi:hypothetical protein